ncbi:triose-phosphate isomerase [Chloroflexota bacterium]
MRQPLIAGNWKMNTTVNEAVELVGKMLPELDQIRGADKLICPPFVSLDAVKRLIAGSSVSLGAQNLYFAEKGAYTGEVSPLMLADLCEFVIVGHSERRQYFHETDEVVGQKVRAALKYGLKPILCIGERLEENDAGRTDAVITGQLKAALSGIDTPPMVIAYEPIWAIGTGRAATGEQANETIGLIRRQIAELYGEEIARNLLVLYGGSVTADNTTEFMEQPEIDGALVGGASLKADQFLSIVRQAAQRG